MDFKLLGCIMLIVGTSIGAGMLALPIATATVGFMGSMFLLLFCWFVMTAAAFLILEVNLWLPSTSHIISMARVTLGSFGQVIAWCSYLFLLYALLAAYIAGGSDLFHDLLSARFVVMPIQWSAIIFTLLLSSVVFFGIRSVDYVNRGLMLIKMLGFIFLVILLFPAVSPEKLMMGNVKNVTSLTAVLVTLTSFGFATIVPSLRVYFEGDVKKLKKAVLIGSLIPLVCYAAWDMVIMGIIPLDGDTGLIAILNSKNSTSDLVQALMTRMPYQTITFLTQLFTSICVVTSFLGVALSLTDFLADGFGVEKKGAAKWLVQAAVFLPPLIMVLFFPSIFVTALRYAGIDCVILLILLPALMAWRGRYHRHIAKGYQVKGGKILLAVLILFATLIIILSLGNSA